MAKKTDSERLDPAFIKLGPWSCPPRCRGRPGRANPPPSTRVEGDMVMVWEMNSERSASASLGRW